MPRQVPLRPGDPRRLGRYRLGGRIDGIPSDDSVFIGLAPDGHEVAISLLRGDWALDGAARDRFAAEAAVARRVPPFCAARMLDAGLEGPAAYLVSEYVPGPSLLELVAADGVMRGNELEAVAVAMATGLASVHQAGLVHGHFGPEYVVMAPHGAPRVIEYGITPPYGMATPSADMLAWAQTVVFAAAGRPPAGPDDLALLPEHVRRPVAQCLDPEPGERPAARAVVLSLLGDAELPGGVLAEGARRAAGQAGRMADDRAAYQQPPAGIARASLPPQRQQAAQQHPAQQHPAQQHPAQQHPAQQHPPSGPHRGHRGQDDRPAAGPRPARSRPAHGGMTADHGAGRERQAGHGAAGRGHRTAWLIAAAVAVAVAAGAAVLGLAQHRPGPTSAGSRLSAAANRTGSGSAAPSPSASVSHGPVLPAAFAGSWSGLVRQPPTDTYRVRVTLTAGTSAGTVSYTGAGVSCSGTLAVLTAAAARLTLSQGIIQGRSNCENGTVTITRTGANTIRFRFGSSGPTAAGTLRRS